MMKLKELFVGMMLLIFSSTTMASNEATGFAYPVGNQNSPPTEQSGNTNGFRISQGFNTSSVGGGGVNDGWCGINFDPKPYNDQTTCESNGFKWYYGHTGIDLSNGAEGSMITAVASGVVYRVLNQDAGYGNVAILQHILPSGRRVYSLYAHMKDQNTLVQGATIQKGAVVGHVGKTIGASTSLPPHLHYALFDEVLIPKIGSLGLNQVFGYLYGDNGVTSQSGNTTMPANLFRYMYDPLLFVDDRNNDWQATLPGTGYWSVNFSSTQSVATRTAYVVNSTGDAKSLQAAVDAGWISSDVWWWSGSSWIHYTNPWPIDSYTISAGVIYAFNMLRSDLTLHWFVPGNNYLDARWRQDMSEFTNVNASLGFGRGLRETYSNNPNWSTTYGITYMLYEQPVSGTMYYATIAVAYSKTDPLVRYVCYYNSQTSVWSSWVRVY